MRVYVHLFLFDNNNKPLLLLLSRVSFGCIPRDGRAVDAHGRCRKTGRIDVPDVSFFLFSHRSLKKKPSDGSMDLRSPLPLPPVEPIPTHRYQSVGEKGWISTRDDGRSKKGKPTRISSEREICARAHRSGKKKDSKEEREREEKGIGILLLGRKKDP